MPLTITLAPNQFGWLRKVPLFALFRFTLWSLRVVPSVEGQIPMLFKPTEI